MIRINEEQLREYKYCSRAMRVYVIVVAFVVSQVLFAWSLARMYREDIAKWHMLRLERFLRQSNPKWRGRVFNADVSGSGLTGFTFYPTKIHLGGVGAIRHSGGPQRDNRYLVDLSPLKGWCIKVFDADGADIIDITPLKGMPLQRLSIAGTRVRDLSPIAGMPLRKIVLRFTPVNDLSPLAGMPLESLDMEYTMVSDLTPLKGMPLRELNISNTPASRRPLPKWLLEMENNGCAIEL